MEYLKLVYKKVRNLLLTPFVIKDYLSFKKIAGSDGRFRVDFKDFYPCVFDKTNITGFDRHYVYHTAWAARKVAEIKPTFHTDISSSLYFSAIVSAFVPVKFYDYRPADLRLDNFSSERVDLLKLPFADNSIKSLSCLHVVEHVGLGRYGDKIDPIGDLKSIKELKRVVTPGGSLLLVVPVGGPRIEFNAHRIYSYDQIISHFKGFLLKEFALISEKGGGLILDDSKEKVALERYGCGCFWFVKNKK
jgi:SAM-dependent methyltransferase